MSLRVFGFAIVLVIAFGVGTTVHADSVISSITQSTDSELDESCGTIPISPVYTITRRRSYNVYCNYQCVNNPQEACSPYASKPHAVSATGECGQMQCKGVVNEGTDAGYQGSAPNEEHIHRIHFENKVINGSACNTSTQGDDSVYFDAEYNNENCTVDACPGSEQEVAECNAGESTWWNWATCSCITSPILLDLDGDGLALTRVPLGARFDLDRDGRRELLSWTAARSRDAFLALDRDGNGVIDDGGELFGSTTEQPRVRKNNGFLALKVFDSLENGGNASGDISADDRVFPRLRAWFDLNHDGSSQSNELLPLTVLGIRKIGLDYEMNASNQDSVGNMLLFTGSMEVGPGKGARSEKRPVIDVFLQHGEKRR